MGFKYWYEGIMFIAVFGVLIAVPCFFTAVIGSKMFNDLGNAPTKSAQIQKSAILIIFGIEVLTFAGLAMFFHFFS